MQKSMPFRLAVKLSIVGGAVYLTANSQYWSNRTEYSMQALESVKKSMPDTVELFNQVLAISFVSDLLFIISKVSFNLKASLFKNNH